MSQERRYPHPPASAQDAVDPNAVAHSLELLLADPLFRNSQRYKSLLAFIVDRSLKGHTADLKERIIGIEVFGRAPDYDTSNDSTVRVVAKEVRERLARYYHAPEHANELRIDIPVGSYLAEFTPPLPDAPVLPVLMPRPLRLRLLVTVALIVLLLLSAWAIRRWLSPTCALDRFWAPVLHDSGPVLIGIGSPLDASGRMEATATPGDSVPTGVSVYSFEEQVKVGMMDAAAAEKLAAFLHQKGKNSVVRPTQGATLAQMRSRSAFLYGMYLNEWAAMLRSDLPFRFRKQSVQGLRWIEVTGNPAARLWAIDMSLPIDQLNRDFALITRVQDPTTGQWWIGVAGLTSIGTLAASQAVMQPTAMNTIENSLPHGWENRNLQIVLEVKAVHGSAGDLHVLSAVSW